MRPGRAQHQRGDDRQCCRRDDHAGEHRDADRGGAGIRVTAASQQEAAQQRAEQLADRVAGGEPAEAAVQVARRHVARDRGLSADCEDDVRDAQNDGPHRHEKDGVCEGQQQAGSREDDGARHDEERQPCRPLSQPPQPHDEGERQQRVGGGHQTDGRCIRAHAQQLVADRGAHQVESRLREDCCAHEQPEPRGAAVLLLSLHRAGLPQFEWAMSCCMSASRM